MAAVPDLSGNSPASLLPNGIDTMYAGNSYGVNLPDVAAIIAAGNVLLQTVAPKSSRKSLYVENQSAADVIIVGDRGNDTQLWQRILTGVGADQQGAAAALDNFIGRLRVYGVSGSRVSVEER